MTIDYPALLADYPGPIDFYDSRRHLETIPAPAFSRGVLDSAGALAARGLRRGDRIALVANNTGQYLTTLLAVLLLGGVPCAIPPPPTPARVDSAGVRHLRAALAVLDPALVITTAAAAAAVSHGVVMQYEELDNAAPLPDLAPAEPDDIHHIQLTSGSTSAPKAVALTHRNVAHNITALGRAMGTEPDRDRIFSWLPMYHDMGLIQVLGGLVYGLPIALMTPLGFLRDPLSWLRNMTHHGSTITAGPTFGYAAATAALARADGTGTRIDLSRLRHAYIGAEPIAPSVLREFAEAFAPLGFRPDTLVPSYGMAESVLATTIGLGGVRTSGSLVSCGPPIEGMAVRVVDSSGVDTADGVIGDIRISGPSVMAGYLEPGGALSAPADGWHDTGDRGMLCAGELFVSGRTKEMLIVRGRNLPPYDVERVIGESPDIGPGQVAVFSVPDTGRGREAVIAVVAAGTTDADQRRQIQRDVAARVRESLGFTLDEVTLVPKGAIPRTTSGKIRRLEVRDRYLQGL